MQSVDGRQADGAKGTHSISAWDDKNYVYSFAQINLGNNSNYKLEIVSTLNILNLPHHLTYFQNAISRTGKYNPKLYLGTIQSVASTWNYDYDSARKGALAGSEKSGSLNDN